MAFNDNIKWGWQMPTHLPGLVTFVNLPFSVRTIDLLVASLVFTKGNSCSVIRRKVKESLAVKPCYSKLLKAIGVDGFRC